MASEGIWDKKIEHVFNIVDFDKDGLFTEKDLELIAESIIKTGNLSEVDGKKVKRKAHETWTKLFQAQAEKGPIDAKAFTDALRGVGHEALDLTVIVYYTPIFNALDVNGDGYITEKEFAVFFQAFQITAEVAAETFKILDTNHDGKLTEEEFLESVRQFHASKEHHTVGNHFFGKLSD